MTTEEAIEILTEYKKQSEEDYYVNRADALDIAIKALEHPIIYCKDCKYFHKKMCLIGNGKPTGKWYCADAVERRKQ